MVAGAPRRVTRHPTDDILSLPQSLSMDTDESSQFAREITEEHSCADSQAGSSTVSDGEDVMDGQHRPHSPQLVEKLLEAHDDPVLKAHTELHPVVRAAREENFCSNLVVADLTKNSSLSQHFQKYALRDFFNHRGQRRYQNLSMSFAAKQHPDIKTTFGSAATTKSGIPTSSICKIKKSPHLSARAYRLATEMVRRDREAIQQRNLENYKNLETKDKIQLEDVQKRQHEMLFLEVANYERYLPIGVTVEELLPLEVSRIQEREEKKRFEKLNSALVDVSNKAKAQYHERTSRSIAKTNVLNEDAFMENEVSAPAEVFDFMKQYWMFRSDDITEIVNNISSWTLAAGLSSSMGIDRSVFCRFLIDVGIVDQDSVPYVWAVRVFDQYARHVRVNNVVENDWGATGDSGAESKTIVAPLVCKLDFVTVMDTIVRRRYSTGTLPEFIELLKRISVQLNADWQRKEQEATAAAAERTKGVPIMEPTMFDKVFAGALPLTSKNQPPLAAMNNMMFGDDAANNQDSTSRNCANENSVWKRNRLISGMLAEPEVLQLVEQYRSVFQELFTCYTYKEETSAVTAPPNAPPVEMEFVDFVQFCQDLRIVPRLASMYDVLRAFRTAECMDYPEDPRGDQDEPATEKTAKTLTEAEKLREVLQKFTAMIFDRFGHLGPAFSNFDVHANESVTINEFKAGALRLGFQGDWKAVFRELDSNRQGKISRLDFMKLQEHVPEIVPNQDILITASDAQEPPPTPRRRGGHRDTSGAAHSHGSRPSVLLSTNSLRKTHTQETNLVPLSMRRGPSLTPTVSRSASRAEGGSITPRSFSRADSQSFEHHPGDEKRASRQRKYSVSGRLGALHGHHAPGNQNTHRNSLEHHSTIDEMPPTEKPPSSSPPLVKPLTPYFGLAAFVETLCRIALTYLIVHGNSVQAATSSRAKIVWLMAYLQTVLEHLRQSHGRRLNSGQGSRSESVAAKEQNVGGQKIISIPPNQQISSQTGGSDTDGITSIGTGVSRQLERTLERVTLHTFKAHDIMVLQRDGHMPSVAAPVEQVEEARLQPEPPEKAQNGRLRRRKSRTGAAMLRDLEIGNEGTSNTSQKSSPTSKEGSPQHQKGTKVECLSTWATRQLHNRAVHAMQIVHKNKSRPAKSKAKEEDSSYKVGKDVGSERHSRRGDMRRSHTSALAAVLDVDKQEPEEEDRKTHREVFAVKQEPPLLQDDSFKFNDLLFKRLLRDHPCQRKEKERLAARAAAASRSYSRALDSRALGSTMGFHSSSTTTGMMTPLMSERASSVVSRSSLASRAERPERPESLIGDRPASKSSHGAESTTGEEPMLTKLNEDRHDLQKGLGGCIGKLERCMLTPPPLNAFATQLNERLEKMMSRAD